MVLGGNSNLISDSAFVNFVKRFDESDLKKTVDMVYTTFCNQYKSEPSFGVSGAIEFVVSIILLKFDKSTTEYIFIALEQMFEENWGPLDYSDYIEKIVKEKTTINYSAFSEAYRYLERNHSWIQSHKCATGKARLSMSNPIRGFFNY